MLFKYLIVAITAASPIGEELVSIPVGVGLGLNVAIVAVVSFAFNLLPALAISGLFWRAERGTRVVRILLRLRPMAFESCCTLDTETPQPAVGSGAEPLGHLGRSGSDSVGGRVRNHADVGGDGDAPETPVGIGGGKPGHTRGSRRVDFGRDIQAVVELGQSPAPESLHPAEFHPVYSNLLDLAIYLKRGR